jgi:3-deoxy-manno-octulosonate cytidylyltransferase (CMP-KDO synthetase)
VNPIIIIPARMAATRLPDKPLADIGGTSMIMRVYAQALKSRIGPVLVAAGDQIIVDHILDSGGRAVLTDPQLPSGSDRIRAALEFVDPAGQHDAVINLQGDMPFVDPATVTACAELLIDPLQFDVTTAVALEANASDRTNPDVVKAICSLGPSGRAGRAHYFTRSTLYGTEPVFRHIGIYGYRRDALMQFTQAPPSPLERREKLEQLRGLEMGLVYGVCVVDEAPISVDNPADLQAARQKAEQTS